VGDSKAHSRWETVRVSGLVNESDFGSIADRVRCLVAGFGSRLSARNAAQTIEFADVGEPELAVEWMADDLAEQGSAITDDERAELVSLAERFGSVRALGAIAACLKMPD
jgi:hypothetical protein